MADNKNTLICPACGEFMEKVYLPEYGMNIDICIDGCGGLWFDNKELEKVDEEHEDVSKILKLLERTDFVAVDESKERWCPVCAQKLVKNSTGATRTIQTDECYACGGKFLDRKELEAMRGEYVTDEGRTAATIDLFMKHHGYEYAQAQQEADKALKNKAFNVCVEVLTLGAKQPVTDEQRAKILDKFVKFENKGLN